MSSRRLAGFVVAALAATSMIAATPAHAGPGDPVECLPSTSGPGTPPQDIVSVNGLDVTVNPTGGVDSDGLRNYASNTLWATYAYPFCVAGDVDDPAWCVVSMPLNNNYVYQDPYTGQVTIRGNEVVADANNCI